MEKGNMEKGNMEKGNMEKGNMEKGNGKKYYDMDSYIIKLRERLTFLAYEADEEDYDEKETKLLSQLLKWVAPRANYETMNKLSAAESLKEFMQTYEFRMYLQDLMEKADDEAVRKEEEAARKRKEPIEYDKDPKYIECPRGEARAIVDLIASRPIRYNKGTEATGAEDSDSEGSHAKILNYEELVKEKDAEARNIGKSRKRRRKAAMRGAAAAIVVLAVFLGGGAAGAYAERETGFFHFFRQSNKGVEIITSPEVMDDEKDVINGDSYVRIGDVPEEYAKEIWMPGGNILPDGLEFDKVSISESGKAVRIGCHYVNPSTGDKLVINKKIYDNKAVYHWTQYDSYEYIGSETLNDKTEIRKYSKKDEDGITYVAGFFLERAQVSVASNISMEYSLQVAKEYIADLE